MALNVGDVAPDFELPAVTGEEKSNIKLSDFRGKKNVVLAFYPLNWTSVCTAQMPGFNVDLEKFKAVDAQVIGISVDSIACHVAWQEKAIGKLEFPLASDFYPHGNVARKYGVFREGDPIPGIAERAVFVIDKQGKIAFAKVYELGHKPDNEESLEVLRKL